MNEVRRQGRQKKRWEDNTREWTGLEFAKFQKAVEKNKEKWRKLFGKSSVVPQRPSRSKDRLADDEEFGRILVLRSDYRKHLPGQVKFSSENREKLSLVFGEMIRP